MGFKKICLSCSTVFKSNKSSSRYCQLKCYRSYQKKGFYKIKINYPLRSCKICEKEFFVKPVNYDQLYCGYECYWKDKKKIKDLQCKNCLKIFTPTWLTSEKAKPKFCSHNCWSFYQRIDKSSKLRGEKHPLWKGGISKNYRTDKNSIQYKEFRWTIFVRDNFTCQICFKKGGELNMDHIKSYILHPKLRLEESNCRTLCVQCHRKTDNYGIKATKKSINLGNKIN